MPEVYNEKVLSIVLSITLLVSASAWAGVADSSNAAAHTTAIPIPSLTPKITDEDMAQLFEVDGKPLQLAKLSTLEMKETEGAWLNFAVGGAIGLGSYAYSNWGNMTWGGALGSTALGAVGGYGAGVAGLRVLGPYANGGAGVAIGRTGITNPNNWYGNASQIVRFDAHRNSSTNFVHVHHRFTPNVGFTRHQPISSLWRR